MFKCLCHSEERSDEESLSYFNRPFVSLRVTDEMREILRYAQNDLSNCYSSRQIVICLTVNTTLDKKRNKVVLWG